MTTTGSTVLYHGHTSGTPDTNETEAHMDGHHTARAGASVTLGDSDRFRVTPRWGNGEQVEIHSVGATAYSSGASSLVYSGSGFAVRKDGITGKAARSAVNLSASDVPADVRRVLAEHLEAAALDLYNGLCAATEAAR